MNTNELLTIARQTIAKVPWCFVITSNSSGGAPNARVVKPGPLRDDWSIGFMTERSCRKVQEIETAGQFTMAFQFDQELAYVALQGRPQVIDDVKIKEAVWSSESDKFHPGGPADSNVVIVKLLTESVELYNSGRAVQPAPTGLCSVRLVRTANDWIQHFTSSRAAA
jgi:general stress protein 26